MVKELPITSEDGADVWSRRDTTLDGEVIQPNIDQQLCPSHTVLCLGLCKTLPISRTLYCLSHVLTETRVALHMSP